MTKQIPPATARRLWLIALVVWLAMGMIGFIGRGDYFDESYHILQVYRFLNGDWQQHPMLTTLPGYHAVLAALVWPWIDPTAPTHHDLLRLFSMLMAATAFPLAYQLVRQSGGSALDAMRRTFAVAALPGITPLAFILYTDVTALVPLLLAVLLATSGRTALASVALAASVLVRQSHIIWLGWIALQRAWALPRRDIVGQLRALAAPLLLAAAFVAFVVYNGGVALGDRASHPSTRISLANLQFGLLFAWLLLLPLQVAALPRARAAIKARPVLALPGVLLAIAFFFGFAPDHPYNQSMPEMSLHNGAIKFLLDPWLRAAATPLVAWSLWAFQFTPMRDPRQHLLPWFFIVSLLPYWMVEPRYTLPALVLFVLLRRGESERVETLLALWLALLGAALMYGYLTIPVVI